MGNGPQHLGLLLLSVLSEISLPDLCCLGHTGLDVLFAKDCAQATVHGNRHGTASQRLHRERYVLRVLLLDVVVRQSSHVIFLSSSKGRSLLLISLIAAADLFDRGDTLHETNVLATECDQDQLHACTALETRLATVLPTARHFRLSTSMNFLHL